MMYASSNGGVDIGLVRELSATIVLYSYFVRHAGVRVGKPFKMELSGLDATYEWAKRQEVGPLSTFLRASLDRPTDQCVSWVPEAHFLRRHSQRTSTSNSRLKLPRRLPL